MHYRVDELLDEYDELTSQILSSDYRYLASRFQQWFDLLEAGDDGVAAHIKYLEGKTNWSAIVSENLRKGTGMVGSGVIDIPKNREQRLGFHLVLFRHLTLNETDIPGFSFEYFATDSSNINETTLNMLSQLFEPFSRELRRYIRWAYDQPEPHEPATEELSAISNVEVPASDRVVSINHNAPEFYEIRTGLEGIEEQLRGSNKIDPDQKGQALAEMAASKSLLSAKLVRLSAIKIVLIGMLIWIGKVFAETALGSAIQTLLPKIYALFPGII